MNEAKSNSYEMLWDCSFCGTKKLLGVSHRHCPGCGAAQDPATRYFPKEGEEIAIKNHIYTGADRVCAGCQAANAAKAAFCVNCGAAQDGSKEVVRKIDQIGAMGQAAKPQPRPAPAVGNKQAANKKKSILLVLICGLAAASAFYLLYGKKLDLEVAGQQWTRSIGIEEFQEYSDTSECSALPGGAEVTRRFHENRTRKVEDGEDCKDVCRTVREDQGDGSFAKTEQCSKSCTTRYRTETYQVSMCAFRAGHWKETRRVSAQGQSVSVGPQWPSYQLKAGQGAKNYGQERAGSRQENYLVSLKNDKKPQVECALKESLWSSLKPGRKVQVEFDVLGNPRCSTLKPK